MNAAPRSPVHVEKRNALEFEPSFVTFARDVCNKFVTLGQAFGAMTRALIGVSQASRVVLVLEGGYDPRGVADCVVEVVASMANGAAQELVSGTKTRSACRGIYRCCCSYGRFVCRAVFGA